MKITFGDKAYELKYTVGGKHIVETYLAEKGKDSLSSMVLATIPMIKKDGGEGLVMNTSFNVGWLYYLLWSLMLTKENKDELTYEKLMDMIFDIEPLSEPDLSRLCHDTIAESCEEYDDIFNAFLVKPKKKRPKSIIPSGRNMK